MAPKAGGISDFGANLKEVALALSGRAASLLKALEALSCAARAELMSKKKNVENVVAQLSEVRPN